MKHLTKIAPPKPWYKRNPLTWGRRWYRLEQEFIYYDKEYNQYKTVPAGTYDGASGALDVCPVCWLVHDSICNDPSWDDGTPINSDVASKVLSKLLEEDGRWIRKTTWKYMTRWFGCVKARAND